MGSQNPQDHGLMLGTSQLPRGQGDLQTAQPRVEPGQPKASGVTSDRALPHAQGLAA